MVLNIICGMAFMLYFRLKLKNGFHMLQQESYLNNEYFHWYRGQKKIKAGDLFPACVAVLCALLNGAAAKIVYILLTVLVTAFIIRTTPKAKKAFVITARVKRLIATATVLGIIVLAAFIVLAHLTFYFALLFAILINILSGVLVAFVNTLNKPIEKKINNWYVNDAKRIISELPNLTVVGITGSYGKTSSKYILTEILSAKYHTLMTPESYNTTMGVVKTVRNSLSATHEIFVCEMGAKYVNDIKEICDIVKPSYAIITSIGPQHLETFGNIQNIINTKLELYDAVGENTVMNVSSPIIKANLPENVITYAISEEDGGDYYATDVSYGPFGARFYMCGKDMEPILLETKLLGKHTVMNVVGAAAMALKLGVSPEQIQYAVKRLKPVPHRLELKAKAGGITVIDDAFNSNVEGSKAAVEVLGKFEEGKRMLITPGMIELGDKEYEYNFEFGVNSAKNADVIILVGENQTKPIKAGIESADFSGMLYVAQNLNEALSKMNELAGEGWTVLFENDLPDLYEK